MLECLLAAAVLVDGAQAVQADAPPPSEFPPAASDRAAGDPPAQNITINGKRPDVVQKIDRRIYAVPADARSASADGYALLRGLPAVTVGLNDTVNLLGSANVTVLVDNKAPPEGNKVLRNLHGADIDHIEVMTNPSAEYSPEGTSGIINIVLKKKHRQGLSGTIMVDTDSFGDYGLDASVKLFAGRWSFDTDLRYRRPVWRDSFSTLRSVESVVGGTPTTDLQTAYLIAHDQFALGQETIGYKVDDKTTVSLGAWMGGNRVSDLTTTQYLGLTPDFASFNQQARSHFRYDYSGVDFTLDRRGAKQGESFKIDVAYKVESNPVLTDYALQYLAASNAPATYHTSRNHQHYAFTAKVDYTHVLSGGRILSLGASDDLLRERNDQGFDNSSGIADLGAGYTDSIRGTRNIAALYGSFQQPVGTWTLLPALRFEAADFTGEPLALPRFATHATNVYPSVHLSHGLARGLDMNLSYTRRTDRPGIDLLNPFTVLTSTTSVMVGNPDLGNQATDAYEANFTYTRKSLTASMLVYDRETANLWSYAYSVTPAALTQLQVINGGHKADRGAEFDLNTPVGKRFKITGSVNLFDSRVPTDPGIGASSIEVFRYTGNATLAWNAPARGDIAGDSAQLQLVYESPSQAWQIRYRRQFTPTLSLSHALAGKLSVVVTVDNAFGTMHTGHVLDAPLTQERLDIREIGPRAAIKLVKTI